MDVNRQAWAGTTSLLVHPAELYVGLRSERTFVQRGQPLEIEVIVTDLDGVAVPDRRVEVRVCPLAVLAARLVEQRRLQAREGEITPRAVKERSREPESRGVSVAGLSLDRGSAGLWKADETCHLVKGLSRGIVKRLP